MNEQHAQDQEALRKLISLKGHETPPPGYGDLLASRIISRLEVDRIAHRDPFLRRIFRNWSFRPALSVVYSLVMIALVCFGRDVAEVPSAKPQTFQAGGVSCQMPGAPGFVPQRIHPSIP